MILETNTGTDEALAAVGETETAAAIAAGYAMRDPRPIDKIGRWFVVPTDTGYDVIDTLTMGESADVALAPRKVARRTVTETAALIDYLARHANALTEVWASIDHLSITAAIDGFGSVHDGNDAGRCEHRVTLQLKHTPEWVAWTEFEGLRDQISFAEHIEVCQADIMAPPGADLLELAQTFRASKTGQFESSQRLKSGETSLKFTENISASAGKSGTLDIPDTFELAIAPFRGGPRYKVVARLRYRIDGGRLLIGYKLDRPEDVLLSAFEAIVQEIRDHEATKALAVFAGTL